MPVYEYDCPKCGEFEITQRITEDSLKKCPTCKSKVKKLISQTSFQLKGTGWYVTDYARSGAPKDSKPAGESTATTESAPSNDSSTPTASTESKSDSNSDSKSDPKSEKKKSSKKDSAAKAAA